MTSSTITVGEFLYELTANLTNFTEYGVSMEAIASGQAAPPPEGARFDVAFEGALTGPKLRGTITGVDYLHIRADGRAQLHIHAEITDDDGEKIAFFADGVAILEEGTPILQLRDNVTLSTSSPAYSWLNPLQVWGVGSVDMAKGQVNVKGYAA